MTRNHKRDTRRPFQPVSKDWNFYRDLALLWPLIIGSFLAGAMLLSKTAPTRMKIVLVVAVVLMFLAVHEKRTLLGGIAGCFTVQSCYVLLRYRYTPAILMLVIAGTVLGLVILFSRNYEPKYQWPDETGGFEMLVIVASIIATFSAWYAVNRLVR